MYCQTELADQWDHCPPIIMFRNKDRPPGFEVPSCSKCNQGTSHADLVAAFFGRALEVDNSGTDEIVLSKILRGISNNIPEVLFEAKSGRAAEKIRLKQAGLPDDMGVLRADGVITNKHLEAFGFKVIIASHYVCTGKMLGVKDKIWAGFYPNSTLFDGTFPSHIFNDWPPPISLVQGKKTASDQFQCSYKNEGGQSHGFLCTFRRSFAVIGLVIEPSHSNYLEFKQGKLIDEVSQFFHSLKQSRK